MQTLHEASLKVIYIPTPQKSGALYWRMQTSSHVHLQNTGQKLATHTPAHAWTRVLRGQCRVCFQAPLSFYKSPNAILSRETSLCLG